MSEECPVCPPQPSPPHLTEEKAVRKRHPVRIAMLVLLVLVLAVGAAIAWEAKKFLETSPAQPGMTISFTVEPGVTFARVAHDLEKQGIITDAFRFRLLARVQQTESRLRAGVFLLNTGWKPQEILHALITRGDLPVDSLTIHEGLAWWQVAKLLEENGYAAFEQFEAVIHDPEFLAEHGIPFANAEGFLFPDTYQFVRYNTPPTPERTRALASRLVGTFWKKTASLWAEGTPEAQELKQLLVLASLVEKETGREDERARVAGVYANRIKKGMLMQADPTVIYGIGPSFSGRLRRSQLNDETNPYNTYKHKGLPPGPICSPGLAAIRAAMEPEQHNYLFFVSRNDGSHQFSRTLNEHINAVNRYQRRGR